jgi:phosphoglycerate dehydrogenase-like enzyme
VTSVIVLDDYQSRAAEFADWASLPETEVTFVHEPLNEEELLSLLADADVVVAMRERTQLPRHLLERLPALRLIVTTGMANAAIDRGAATELGITICGTHSGGGSTTEVTWAILLGLVKRTVSEDAALRAGRWQTELAGDLAGRTLGLIGFGRLGQAMVPIATAFGMPIIAWSQNLDPAQATAVGVEPVEKDELFRRSDVLSIHTRLSDRTAGLVGAREFSLMKPTAVLVNSSRGPIVDEAALVTALRDGTIAGAALDVYDIEPLPKDHPFLGLRNTVLSPHLGYASEDNVSMMYREVVEDIAAYFEDAPIRVVGG